MTSDTTSTGAGLPDLTALEADAAIAVAWAAPGDTMLQVAAKLKLAPSELAEILERPHVAAFAHAARDIELMHADALARHNRATAIADLFTVARDAGATTVPGGGLGTPTVPGGSQPDRHASDHSTSALTSDTRPVPHAHAASPVTHQCTAGAARRTHANLAPRPAPSPNPDRPP